MNSFGYKEDIYQSETMDVEKIDESDKWENERHLLKQEIKDLTNALEKSKLLHRKFADNVIESEEIRNKYFDRVKRELDAVIKRQLAEIRELTKDKHFYEATCNALMSEKEMNSTPEPNQSTSVRVPFLPIKCSNTESFKPTTKPRTRPKSISGSDSKYKISAKLFEDNKKLKGKISNLTKSNATLRLQVKQLENFKNKIHNRQQQQVADQHELQDLVLSTKRTNGQIFNKSVLAHLDQYHKEQSITEK